MPWGNRQQVCISDNVFAHCDQSGGENACWPFLRSKNQSGYGRVWVGGKCTNAHRLAYIVANGLVAIGIPDGLHVRHECDNPPCCNPKHLLLGTNSDNVRDRVSRDRSAKNIGEINGSAELTTRDVLFIKRCHDIYTTYEMAKMLGVSDSTVSNVTSGRKWGHIMDGKVSFGQTPLFQVMTDPPQ